jgi:hypothetical protein
MSQALCAPSYCFDDGFGGLGHLGPGFCAISIISDWQKIFSENVHCTPEVRQGRNTRDPRFRELHGFQRTGREICGTRDRSIALTIAHKPGRVRVLLRYPVRRSLVPLKSQATPNDARLRRQRQMAAHRLVHANSVDDPLGRTAQGGRPQPAISRSSFSTTWPGGQSLRRNRRSRGSWHSRGRCTPCCRSALAETVRPSRSSAHLVPKDRVRLP